MAIMNWDPYEVVNLFKTTNIDLYEKMNAVVHDARLDSTGLSVHHAEGSIWTHTSLVLNNLINSDKEVSISLFLAGLLHDIGKVETVDTKEITIDYSVKFKNIFYDHDSVSTVMAVDVLLNMYRKIENVPEFTRILELVNFHMMFNNNFGVFENGEFYIRDKEEKKIFATFAGRTDLYCDLLELIKADSLGRICSKEEYSNTLAKDKKLTSLILYLNKTDPKINEVEKKRKCYMLIGLPGTGKTYYRKKMLEAEPKLEVVSFDDLVENYARLYGLSYTDFFAQFKDTCVFEDISKDYDNKLREVLSKGRNVIFDATNLTKKSRRRKLPNDKIGYYKIAIVFLARTDSLEKVNKDREKEGKYISNSVYMSLAKNMMLPSFDEFDSIVYKVRTNDTEHYTMQVDRKIR